MPNGTRRAWETRGEEQEFFFFFPRKETTFRLSSPRRPRWCNGSAFALDHFSFFFSLPPPPLPISYLAAPDIRHTFSLLSPPSLPYFLRYPALPILSFRSSIANNSPLPPLRAFMIRRGEKSAWNGTRNPLGEEFYRVEGKVFSVRHLSFFFF